MTDESLKDYDNLKKFNTGKLGDDAEWFDWLFVYGAYMPSDYKFPKNLKITTIYALRHALCSLRYSHSYCGSTAQDISMTNYNMEER